MLRAAARRSTKQSSVKPLHHLFCNIVRLDADQDDVAELLDRHLKPSKSAPVGGVATTGKEALSLYRKIQRYTLVFDWPDETGELWRDKLRRSVRKEFEDARFEHDPQVVTKLLLTSSDAVEQIMRRFLAKRQQLEAAGQVPKRAVNPYTKI
jgi:Complex 1 protein (LYR family)